MLFFDTSDRKTFVNVKDVWWPEVRDAASDATGLSDSISLVQNKMDSKNIKITYTKDFVVTEMVVIKEHIQQYKVSRKIINFYMRKHQLQQEKAY